MKHRLYNIIQWIITDNKYTWTEVLAKVQAKNSDSTEELLCTMAKVYYELGEQVNCLSCLSYYCEVSEKNSAELWSLIQDYYSEDLKTQRLIYEQNRTLLKPYAWCSYQEWCSFEALPVVVFYQDAQQIIYIERATGIMQLEEKHEILVKPDEYTNSFLLYNINNVACINKLATELQYPKSHIITWQTMPMYSYYSTEEKFLLAIQTNSLQDDLLEDRLIFFVGWQAIEQSKIIIQINQLEHILAALEYEEEKKNFLYQLKQNIILLNEQYTLIAKENSLWYKEHKERVINNIRRLKPKILFISTKFTMVKHNRDCVLAAQGLGCATYVLEEISNFAKISATEIIQAINDFKPDMIFRMYYFPEPFTMPANLPYVTWVQDPLPHIMDKNSHRKLMKNNFLLVCFPKKSQMIELGYNSQRLLSVPIPANHKIYQPYILTELEQEKYQTDICLVCNNACFEEHILAFRDFCKNNMFFADTFEKCFAVFEKIMRCYLQQVNEETILIDTEIGAEQYLVTAFSEASTPVIIKDKASWEKIVRYFYTYTTAYAFRDALAHWLIAGGYNIKLYGHDWQKNPDFAPYAMGGAPNGEILSKIYQSAKVILGTNPLVTASARVYEAYLSEAFYISNYVRPEADYMDIRDQFTEIPFFYNKQDLYNKLDYYLAQPDKRTEIIKKTREKALQIGTFEALMKKMLQWLADEVGK